MLRLMKLIKGEEEEIDEEDEGDEEEESRCIEDSKGTVYLGGKRDFKQFEELHRSIRHKK